MNSLGRLFRITILGESHGECVGVVIDGCPAGLPLVAEDFEPDMARRRGASQQGTTSRAEPDLPQIRSGLFNGHTSGAPLLIELPNSDVRSQDYEFVKARPRPGHADFVAQVKFGGFNDYRGGGHFSGRLTAALVAAGVVAKKLIEPVKINAQLLEAGGSRDFASAVLRAKEQGDSIGALIECVAKNLPVGLGEPFFDSLESQLSHAVFSIPAVKGIEFGLGFESARRSGSEVNDEIVSSSGRTRTNNCGGINGGISNGNEIVFRIAVKPTSSIARAQHTINLESKAVGELCVPGRHDTCIGLRVPPVLEAVTALVLCDFMRIAGSLGPVWRRHT